MGTIIAAIIGGVIAIGTTIAGAVVESNMADEANAKAEEMWNTQRTDEKKMKKDNEKVAKWDRRFQQQQFQFGKEVKTEQLKTEKETLAFNKRQKQLQNTLGIINGIPQARSVMVEMFNRRKAA